MEELLKNLEELRIDIDTECAYQDPTGMLQAKYERANEMLDDCINIVKNYKKPFDAYKTPVGSRLDAGIFD